MPTTPRPLRLDRRAFLAGGLGFTAGLCLAPGALAARRDESQRHLVLVQLSGGNDGLSTLVPYGDDAYHAARDATRIAAESLHRLDEYRGLHPALTRLAARYDAGELALVQGVGYPGPNRSHFKSLEVWHAAHPDGRVAGDGWIGKLCDARWPQDAPPELVVHLGKDVPYALHSAHHPPVAFEVPETYQWLGDGQELDPGADEPARGGGSVLERLRRVQRDAQASSRRIRHAAAGYRTDVEYPATREGRALRTAAALLDAGLGTRVVSVDFGGFDTHSSQRGRHDELMRTLDGALGAFLADLRGRSIGAHTLVLVFSEFGRRVRENGSGGTDHGKAGLVLAAGAPVQGGLYGAYPSLTDLDGGDLRYAVDFRRCYAAALRWLGADPTAVLGEPFEPVPFV
ncbi:MAG: DUF1501 domain-containing protein [Planctomycetes bacterium]|nr:DUF1501 domain-containing protein [Planctomycetota bacterium]